MSALRVEARPFQPGDERLLLAGLEGAVRATGAGPRRALEELSWRYGRAPHGACLALAFGPGERPLAGLCATRQRVRFQGGEVFWLEVGDLFNDFSAGTGLVRARALLEAGRAFAEAFGGFAPEKHPVLYGLPDRRAHRLGLRHLEWEVLRSENELFVPLPGTPPRPLAGAGTVKLEEPARFPDEVERAFERGSEGREAVLVRDAALLNWRYVDRPGAAFARVLARRAGEPVGYAVRRGGRLFEWGARPDDEEAVQALVAWARDGARAAGEVELTAVFPDSAPEWLLFQRLGFRVRGTGEYLCFRSFQRPAIMSWLYRNWSYTRGDTLR